MTSTTAPAAFGVLGGERLGGLWDQRGLVEPWCAAQRGDDAVVEPARADGGVAQVDDGVPGWVQPGQRGADGDGLPGTDLTGDHPEGAFGDAPADPGDGFAVAGVAVQHLRGEVAAERGAAEPVVGLEPVDGHDARSAPSQPGSAGSAVRRR